MIEKIKQQSQLKIFFKATNMLFGKVLLLTHLVAKNNKQILSDKHPYHKFPLKVDWWDKKL